jgi:hypothetical protein
VYFSGLLSNKPSIAAESTLTGKTRAPDRL